jgi:hypothetical protein
MLKHDFTRLTARDAAGRAAGRAEHPAHVIDPLASLESTNGRVGLHVSCVVKTQFHHAPESHACLNEVGETHVRSSPSTT